MQFLEKIFLPLNIKRDKQNNNLLTDIKNRSIDLLEWLKKAFPSFVNVNNGLTNTTYLGDSTNVQLGGNIIQTTEVSFDGGTNQPLGLWFLPDGFQDFPNPNTAVFLGAYVDPNDLTNFNGVAVGLVNGIIEATSIGNSKAIGEFVKLSDGSGQIDLEVNSPDGTLTYALKMNPGLLTVGDYINATEIYLNLDNENGLYQIGDLNNSVNGTYISIENFTELVKITNVPLYADDAAAITGGLTTGHLYKTTTGGITSLNIVP